MLHWTFRRIILLWWVDVVAAAADKKRLWADDSWIVGGSLVSVGGGMVQDGNG